MPAAVGGRRQEADVAGQGPQVARVVGQAFQLQGHAAEHLGADRDLASAEGLDGLAIGRGVADGRVAGDGFQGVQGPPVGPAGQRPLRAAMLITERNLQVEDLLAVTLEAEMPRLDHARMHRADGHLVDLFAFDAIEIGDAADGRFAAAGGPRRHAPADTRHGTAPA